MAELQFVPIKHISESMAAFWNSANPDFFSSISWLKILTEHVFDHLDVTCGFLLAEDQGEVIGLSPVYYTDQAQKPLEWHSLSNYYSPIIKPLVYKKEINASDKNSVGLTAFLNAIRNRKIPWDVWIFRPMSKDDTLILLTNFRQVGISAIPFYCFANWYMDVNGRSFEQYFVALPGKVRNTVLRKTKQFESTPETDTIIIVGEDNLTKFITDYEAIYRESWKVDETFPEFIAALIRLAAKMGALRLGLAYINNEPVAAQIWIVADGNAYIYKLAYNEKFKQHAVGTILTAKLMQYVIDVDKVNTVDYLTGDDSYKQDWMSARRERWGVKAYNSRSFYGILSFVKEITKYYVHNFLNRSKVFENL